MLTLKQLHKQIEKTLVTPTYTDEEVSFYINSAMEQLFKICIICKKECKSARGVIIHMSKNHKKTWLLSKKMKRALLQPEQAVRVYWDNNRA